MTSDLDRFLRAVRTLAKLAFKYDDDAFLDNLGRYATVKQEGDVQFVGEWLQGFGYELSRRRDQRCYLLHCRQCGKEIEDDVRYNGRNARADAQYCGSRCRQRAYRGRVTAITSKCKRKRNGITERKRNGVTAEAVNAAASRNANAAEDTARQIQPRLFVEIVETTTTRDHVTADGVFIRPPPAREMRKARRP